MRPQTASSNTPSQPGKNTVSTAPPALRILNTPVHILTMSKTLAHVQQYMGEPGVHQIATTNPEFVMAAQQDGRFMEVLQQADLCVADGVGLVLASRWLGKPLPERIPGSELIYHLARMAAEEEWQLFLLGAAPGVAEEAAAVFQRLNPGLIIAGTYAGSPDPAENDDIVRRINDSEADMLFVAYGAPRQDKWIARNRQALKTVRLAMGVGGALDFVSGRAIRAPEWIQKLGLEWLHRLVKEPWRWRRMLALPRFAVKVLVSGRQV